MGLVCSRFLTVLEGSTEMPPRLQEQGFPQQALLSDEEMLSIDPAFFRQERQ